MKQILLFITCLAVAAFTLGNDGTAGSGCQNNVSAWLNNPGTQSVITDAENIATQFFVNWVSHLGGSRGSKAGAMAAARSAIKARYPQMPDNIVNDIVAAKFSGK